MLFRSESQAFLGNVHAVDAGRGEGLGQVWNGPADPAAKIKYPGIGVRGQQGAAPRYLLCLVAGEVFGCFATEADAFRVQVAVILRVTVELGILFCGHVPPLRSWSARIMGWPR